MIQMLFAVVLWVTAFGPTGAVAQVPNLLPYQGHLTDASGTNVTGTVSMQFAIYDAVSGGNQLPTATPWSETQSVAVEDGVFSVMLGNVTALPEDLFTGGPTDSKGALRFLQIHVNGEPLVPRQRIGSAAYAIAGPSDAIRGSYDSGWFAVSVNTDYTRVHSLGTTKVLCVVYGATSSAGANMGVLVNHFGESVTQGAFNLTDTQVRFRFHSNSRLNTGGGVMTAAITHARIIMLALE